MQHQNPPSQRQTLLLSCTNVSRYICCQVVAERLNKSSRRSSSDNNSVPCPITRISRDFPVPWRVALPKPAERRSSCECGKRSREIYSCHLFYLTTMSVWAYGVEWTINRKGCGRKRAWHNLYHRDVYFKGRGKSRKTLRRVSVLTEIRTRHLQNTIRQRSHLKQFLR